ncbi:hypothetical protein [Fusobacterium vincentii ATCC 49256]|uniref:Uncharacterized protein n=1 Tax=Fusobacterium vincentii ATCC 49256 TaxID=209882 RepID=Q7P5U3_FUSVC|nr:hypothetical protein [Fusobacterium vincentii ATCC 49256]
MIKIIKNNEMDKNTRYKIYATRCNCCNETNNVNVLDIRADNSNAGTIISICDKWLQEVKKEDRRFGGRR